MFRYLALTLALAAMPLAARSRVDLNGAWRFAIDPHRAGEKNGWSAPKIANAAQWGTGVTVPHCWPVDPRYPYHGPAWYRRVFPTPPESQDRHVRLVFEAVFYRARVWLNGQLLGAHEGGYTPFEFDLAGRLQSGAANVLVLEVDNSWSNSTIPGSRPGSRPENQVYPWWDYGGIVRDVYLAVTAPVYVSAQRIVGKPNLEDGTARVSSTVWVRNTTDAPSRVRVSQQNGAAEAAVTVAAKSTMQVELSFPLRREEVRLWDQDHPHLYRMRTTLRAADSPAELDVAETRFGIRSIEARDRLLLNGEPIRMGGANRHSDHPKFGLIEPKELVDADMRLMKTAGMELGRISHYPVPTALLDWADENGVLIIEQGPIWGTVASQLASPQMRALFRTQLEEMIRRDWNHPSVIGWSVGNEYESDRPEGVSWTREMVALVRSLDPTRLTSMASMHAFRGSFSKPEEEASHHVDLININMYGPPGEVRKRLDRVHSLWPNRVVLISEFVSMDALTLGEAERVRYAREFLDVIRKYHYVAGVSLWTFNDYRSRWPQTGNWPSTSADGYRHFGAVTADRRTLGLYDALRQEFSPAVIREVRPAAEGGKATVRVAARPDFPSYTLRDYAVRCTWMDAGRQTLGSATARLPVLRPGEETGVTCACRDCGGNKTTLRVEVVRPTGFAAVEQVVDLK